MSLSWIKIDINIMDDTKIKQLRKMPAGDTLILFWVHLLCLAMKSGKPGILEIGDGIPFNAETLAIDFGVEIATVKMALGIFEKFRMIEQFEDGTLYITNFEKHQELGKIERQKQVSRNSSKKHRDRQKKLLSDGHVTNGDETDKDLDLEEDLEKEIDKEIKDNNTTKPKNGLVAQCNDFEALPEACNTFVRLDGVKDGDFSNYYNCKNCGQKFERHKEAWIKPEKPSLYESFNKICKGDFFEAEESNCFKQYLFDYHRVVGKPHPQLRDRQVLDVLEIFTEYIENVEEYRPYSEVLNEWFTRNDIESDYNILHFAAWLKGLHEKMAV